MPLRLLLPLLGLVLAHCREDPEETQAGIDAQLLKTNYMRSDGKGLRTILGLLKSSGGKDRVDAGFVALRHEFGITAEMVKQKLDSKADHKVIKTSGIVSGVMRQTVSIPQMQAIEKVKAPPKEPEIHVQKITSPPSFQVPRHDAASQPAVVGASEVSEPQRKKVDQAPIVLSAPHLVKADPLRLRNGKVAARRAVHSIVWPPRKFHLRKPMQSIKAAAASVKKVDPPASRSTMQHDSNKSSGKPGEWQQTSADAKSSKQDQLLGDGQVLEGYIKRKDRNGMKTALQNILKVGGADKVADAFAALESMRYNSQELQRWITHGGEVPVEIIPGKSNAGHSDRAAKVPQSEWSPVKDALETFKNLRYSAGEWLDFSKHVSKDQIKQMLEGSNEVEESDVDGKLPHEDAQALDKYLKVRDLRSTKRLMKDMLIDGGLHRVESALGELQSLGYDPVKVQKMLEGDGPSPIKSKRRAKYREQFSEEIPEVEEELLSPIQDKKEAEREEQPSKGFSEEDDMPSFMKVHDNSATQLEADEDDDTSLALLLKKASVIQAKH